MQEKARFCMAYATGEASMSELCRRFRREPQDGLSGVGAMALSVRLVKAGVVPERIDPASPQQNGRLERLHLTLAQETARPPAGGVAAAASRSAHSAEQDEKTVTHHPGCTKVDR